MPNTRPPARAGQFYPASEKALRKKIKKCYTHPLGPGEIPELNSGGSKIKGAVVPHAGYDFSGPVAAHVYGAIAEGGFPDNFVILGPKHADPFGAGRVPDVGVTLESFEMPFGSVSVDEELADEIVGGLVEVSSDMHASEHSIEVQLPFLQFFDVEFGFVPVCISSQVLDISREIGKRLGKAVEGRDVTIIASTDFTHCGPRYGQVPPEGKSAGDFAEEQDEKAIDRINDLDAEGLSQVIDEYNISMCGYGGVMAMIFAIKEEVEKGKLLKYATSQDITSGRDAVGYGGIVFK